MNENSSSSKGSSGVRGPRKSLSHDRLIYQQACDEGAQQNLSRLKRISEDDDRAQQISQQIGRLLVSEETPVLGTGLANHSATLEDFFDAYSVLLELDYSKADLKFRRLHRRKIQVPEEIKTSHKVSPKSDRAQDHSR